MELLMTWRVPYLPFGALLGVRGEIRGAEVRWMPERIVRWGSSPVQFVKEDSCS